MPVVSDDAGQPGPAKVDVGIYATPEEYLAKACELVHPIDGELSVSDWTKRAIFEVLTTHPAAMSKRRTDFLKKVLERRAQLESDEIALHKTMVPHVRRVMKGKKLLLLKSLLVEYGYDDPGVMNELISGAPMTGTQRVPPCAERRIKLASSTKEILEAEAKWRTQAILRRQTPEEDKEILCSLGDKEVGMGFLSGPYTAPQRRLRPIWADPIGWLTRGSCCVKAVKQNPASSTMPNHPVSTTPTPRVRGCGYRTLTTWLLCACKLVACPRSRWSVLLSVLAKS